MKRWLLPVLLLIGFPITASAKYDPRLVHVLEQLRACRLGIAEELPMVGGGAVGAAASPHEFYLLFPYISAIASTSDLVAMLEDTSPVVRIMAAKCLLRVPDPAVNRTVEKLSTDKAELFVAPSGCTVLKKTVAEVVSDLKKDPSLFGEPQVRKPTP